VSYVEQHLQPREQVIYRATLHPIGLVGPAIVGLIGLDVLLSGFRSHSAGVWLFGLILMLPLLMAFLNYQQSEFAVTSQRVVIKIGIVRRRSLEIILNKVEGVSVDQGILGRMLDFGSITVNGTGGTPEPFRRISKPLEFRRNVQAAVEQTASAPSPSALPPTPTPAAAISTATRQERDCPHCAEPILARAKTCKHCGRDVEPVQI
jgi:membrane protein YdbS with pleckstrin-like domain